MYIQDICVTVQPRDDEKRPDAYVRVTLDIPGLKKKGLFSGGDKSQPANGSIEFEAQEK